ncbi:MAG: MnmC family methyltransferase [Nanoarchaeota archaeon]
MLKKILTADNTESFLNETVGESYHSYSGAVEEALKKYAIPCKIRELAKEQGKIRILDFCFGLGYNSAMAISVALQENPDCEIEVVGLENDVEIIKRIPEVNPPIPYYQNYKRIQPIHQEKNHPGSWGLSDGTVSVKVLLGDARETVKQLPADYFDAIFYDPFSPKTMPELWSMELFQEMARVMKSSALLATYSCARTVRENMSKAGLLYDEGPIVGRRGPGTVATKWV